MSPRLKLAKDKMRQLHREGKWPPEGHPLKALAALDPKELEEFFQGKTWQALVEGLKVFRDNAIQTALRSRDLSTRDEARGVANMATDMLEWGEEVIAFTKAIRED
jgi:hypothetical protein